MPFFKNGDVATMEGGKKIVSLVMIGVSLALASCSGEQKTESIADRGAEVFSEYCVRCHGSSGEGSAGVPDIRKRDLWSQSSDTLLFILAFGMRTGYSADSVNRTMPPVPYSDADLARVAEYVSAHIGGVQRSFTAADVQRVRKEHKTQVLERLGHPVISDP